MNEAQLAALPESVRDWDEAKNADTPEVFWDQMTNLRSKIGTGLYKPGDDAGDEDWGKFSNRAVELSGNRLMPRPDLEDETQRNALYTSLGRPEDKTGYEFATIEGSEIEADRKEFISQIAFEAGLTKSQLKLLDQKIREADYAGSVEAQNVHVEALKGLKQEWGMAYDERVHAAKKIATTFFPHMDAETNFTAAELKSFHSLYAQLGKGGSEFRQQEDQHQQGVTPQEAADKISEIRNNREHPYHDKTKTGHEAAKKKMRELYLIKNNLPPA